MDEAESVELERARAGDREAFGLLVRRHQRRVYAAALHILGNHSDADDVTQDTFVRAFRGLASFDGRSELSTWLYRITVNTALNALRSDKRGSALATKSSAQADHVGGRPEALGQSAATPAQVAQQNSDVARVLTAISQLSASLRVTLVLATVEDLPHKQIAEILEIPEGTVAWRVNEARRLLRQKLATDESTPQVPAAGVK
jgi:RNA polymerase sigma-70 factor, ECF subfamily